MLNTTNFTRISSIKQNCNRQNMEFLSFLSVLTIYFDLLQNLVFYLFERCVSGIQVLHEKHSRGRNTYEIEAFMLPAEYLKQKVSWKKSKLINHFTEVATHNISNLFMCL